jgi:hypothetical protein
MLVLGLGGNQIDDQGVECLVYALETNIGNIIHYLPLILFFFCLFQVLNKLNLNNNNIGELGATHLANILNKAKVFHIYLQNFILFKTIGVNQSQS